MAEWGPCVGPMRHQPCSVLSTASCFFTFPPPYSAACCPPPQCRAGDPVPAVSHPEPRLEKVKDGPGPHILTLGPFSRSLISLHKIPPHLLLFCKERERRVKKKKKKTELNCFSSTSRIIVFAVCLGRRSPLIFCPGLGNLLYVAPRLPSSAHPGNPSS